MSYWETPSDRVDNHWLDCLVGCAVCASMLGAALPETLNKARVVKPKIKLSEKQQNFSPITTTKNTKLKLSQVKRSRNG